MKKNLSVFCLCLFFAVVPLFAFSQHTLSDDTQDEVPLRRFGLVAGFQNSEFTITLPVFFSRQFSIAPSVGFTYAEGVGYDLALGLMPKIYFSNKRLMPFLAARAGTIINMPAQRNMTAEKNRKDYLAGLGLGAEYFLSGNFSFGVEAQGNFTISDETSGRFGNPGGNNFNLGTAVTANIYFLR